MKAIFTTVLLLLITFCIANANIRQAPKDMSHYIALQGHYVNDKIENPGNTRSLHAASVQACIDSTGVFFEFSSSITELTVTFLKDDSIIFCQQFSSIEAGQQEIVDLFGFEAGEYQLLLTTPMGSYLTGRFVW